MEEQKRTIEEPNIKIAGQDSSISELSVAVGNNRYQLSVQLEAQGELIRTWQAALNDKNKELEASNNGKAVMETELAKTKIELEQEKTEVEHLERELEEANAKKDDSLVLHLRRSASVFRLPCRLFRVCFFQVVLLLGKFSPQNILEWIHHLDHTISRDQILSYDSAKCRPHSPQQELQASQRYHYRNLHTSSSRSSGIRVR